MNITFFTDYSLDLYPSVLLNEKQGPNPKTLQMSSLNEFKLYKDFWTRYTAKYR